jgi:glycosyltransferase involved in cell wall biosynthesis
MRLAFDLSVLRHPPAGTARYAIELHRAMVEQDDGDEIVAANGWPRRPRAPRWRLANLASDLGWLTIGADAVALRRRVDAWYSPSNSLPLALPRPTVVTIHDTTFLSGMHDRWYARYARLVYGAAGRSADAVIAPSEASRLRLIADLGVHPERVTVAYPGVEHLLSVVPADRDPRLPSRYALTVCQTEPHKNLPALVAAWATRVPAGLDLVIAGPRGRGEAELAAAIGASPSRDRILRVGRVDDAALARLYRDATCFIFPSLAEGFGLPPLEAMGFGIPTAVADSGSLPEVTGGAALTFDPRDPSVVADVVERLAEDTDLRSDLGRRGLAVAGRYRWNDTARKVWRLVREVAGEPQSAGSLPPADRQEQGDAAEGPVETVDRSGQEVEISGSAVRSADSSAAGP